MSKAKRVAAAIVDTIASETDVAVAKIISRCSESEVVEARWICVRILSEYGYYTSRIAGLMKITPRYVQYILTDFDDRAAGSPAMRKNYETIAKKLRNNCEITPLPDD